MSMFFYLRNPSRRNPDDAIRALERKFQGSKNYQNFKPLFQAQIRQGIPSIEALQPLKDLDHQLLSNYLIRNGYQPHEIQNRDDNYTISDREFMTIFTINQYLSSAYLTGRIHDYHFQILFNYTPLSSQNDPLIEIRSDYDLSHHQYHDWKHRLENIFPYQFLLPEKILLERIKWEERRDRIRARWKASPPQAE